MKKALALIAGVLVTTSTVFATSGEAEKVTYEIDTKESKVYWTGKKITGSSHEGYISIGDGMVDVKNNSLIGGQLNIDMNSIVCTDIEKAESNKKLVKHLENEDFFSVENHPNANFEITSVQKDGDGADYKIIGKLSMKGKTNEISFPAKVNVSGGKVTAYGTALVDRTKFGIEYKSGSIFKSLGDKAISDDMEIRFELFANADDVN